MTGNDSDLRNGQERRGSGWDRNSFKLEEALYNLLDQNLNLILFIIVLQLPFKKKYCHVFSLSSQQIMFSSRYSDIITSRKGTGKLYPGMEKRYGTGSGCKTRRGNERLSDLGCGLWEKKIQARVKGQMHRSLTFPCCGGAGHYANIQVGTGSSNTLGSLVSGTLL